MRFAPACGIKTVQSANNGCLGILLHVFAREGKCFIEDRRFEGGVLQ